MDSPPYTPPKKKSKKDEFEEAVLKCGGNFSLLAAKGSYLIADLEKDNNELEIKYRKLLSIGIAREYVEEVEEDMSSNFQFPSKKEMIEELKRKKLWEYTEKGVSIYYVRFYYYVSISNKPLATYIKNCLGEQVSLHDFCCLVAKLYSKSSARIHDSKEKLTIQEMKEGLILFGINQPKLLECLDVLEKICRQPLRSPRASSGSTNISSVSTNDSFVRNITSTRTPNSNQTFLNKATMYEHLVTHHTSNNRFLPYDRNQSSYRNQLSYRNQPSNQRSHSSTYKSSRRNMWNY